MVWDVWKDCLQQEWDRKCELHIISQINNTHSGSQRVSKDQTTHDFPFQKPAKLAPQMVACALRQERLPEERDGNDQAHVNISFASNQTHIATQKMAEAHNSWWMVPIYLLLAGAVADAW